MCWQLQEAKNKLSEVIQAAQKSGPQAITVRGRETAVILSAEDYRRLTMKSGSLVSFFQASPWAEVELDLTRSKDVGRDIEL
ncbi:type II toxin-antitoxin system Phd/YefM family antitoxin [Methylococcus mesophilus]|uniref:type II toxin-antitoxin system Phd/YefM family antitoxin n=1 Tax=Methylococcus mesophilus TaxID=2993564 RepID=UPI00224B8F38|nr:type II toxin-antitoxin system Phd/YefM family antitoxin [Methylococcus mesophilus]UZR30609.1 type II toxin-antitoxin system Phd/YefM family antitoxin [Methylococcus mesophilus]